MEPKKDWVVKIEISNLTEGAEETTEEYVVCDTRIDAYLTAYSRISEADGYVTGDNEFHFSEKMDEIITGMKIGIFEYDDENENVWNEVSIEAEPLTDSAKQALFWKIGPYMEDILFFTDDVDKDVKEFDLEDFWNKNVLPNKRISGGHAYDFYPHGKVVIDGDAAVIYATEDLCKSEIKFFLKFACGLDFFNGIKSVEMRDLEGISMIN